MSKTVLVVGSGGREAMYAWRLKQDEPSLRVVAIPGNGGMLEFAECYPHMPITNLKGIVDLALAEKPEFVIIGPEGPLIAGLADRLAEKRIPTLGPSKLAAEAEGNKVWFKDFLRNRNLPTPDFWAFRHDDGAKMMSYVSACGGAEKIVLKARGECGGKGVVLPETDDELHSEFVRLREEFKENADNFVVEKREKGEEYSAIAITDSKTLFPFVFTRDAKRRYDDDQGPNTGSMGAFTIHPSSEVEARAISLLREVVDGLTKEGRPFKGIIYLGLILTDEGLKILECNCRGGDPEMQAILASIDGNFYDLCRAAAVYDLGSMPPPRMKYESLCVVLTSPEYPRKSERDNPIPNESLAKARATGAIIIPAGTERFRGQQWTHRSGRILNSIGRAPTFAEAHRIAYAGAEALRSPDLDFRTDIGRSRLKT